ncbi:MAG: phosphopentomutase [Planctomycetes bacterium]|jgi:phosphopentomutase|nr:phosphopentomutase [Planctomycetota bacterium]HNZ67501.1 phosphopentomutase [Planctomycetota bacterium]HPY74152.1 phosphopentomutase [Planctomycetota bacterium]HQA99765.1 phosphopentomutase [Planctomycetota bacterium]
MAKKFKRIFIIILDGVGVGALPDAHLFGDEDSNTLFHINEAVGLNIPNLAALGLSNIIPLQHPAIKGAWGKMAEFSMGKDTTTGHWEIAGVQLEKAFPTYPNGFPKEIIEPFCQQIGREILGNYPASGTEIIQKLGDEHVATGKPIVYTSADSVFQIAAHEEVIPVPELYKMCQIARDILVEPHAVGRVIARPFIGTTGNYTRTKARHDYSLEPVGVTILDALKEAGYDSIGVGKIEDIFAGRGLTKSYPVKGNELCMKVTLELLDQEQNGLIFVNLVDFDMLYGHRQDPLGFKNELEKFDKLLPTVYSKMKDDDLLILTADHGNDPCTPGTDHTREYVPLLVYHHNIKLKELPLRQTFADIAKTIDENFELNTITHGTSFYQDIL